ncbi:MAG: Cof-type HAD-IIB family hydrolase [Mycoplasmataceae bacterium]|nr:Cof-type HAD-IIB family hydrolase [Mycoplasmataceae bacterium]
MKPQAIFIDLDNTLIPHSKHHFSISMENLFALKTAQKKHIYIVIATGRSIEDVREVYEKYRINDFGDYIIYNNSAGIQQLGPIPKVLLNEKISIEQGKKIIEELKQLNVFIKLSENRILYYKKMNLVFWIFLKMRGMPFEKQDKMAPDFSNFAKIGFIPPMISRRKISNLIDGLKEKFPEQEIITSGSGRFVEITKLGVTKSKGIEFLADRLDLDLTQCVAIGDSENDVSMFKVVGYPIAMKNARKNIKKHAKFQTDTSKRNGVAKAIKSIYEI